MRSCFMERRRHEADTADYTVCRLLGKMLRSCLFDNEFDSASVVGRLPFFKDLPKHHIKDEKIDAIALLLYNAGRFLERHKCRQRGYHTKNELQKEKKCEYSLVSLHHPVLSIA